MAAHELMLGTSEVRNLVCDGKVAQLYSTIQTAHGPSMQTLDQSLVILVQQGLIDAQEAQTKAKFPESFVATR